MKESNIGQYLLYIIIIGEILSSNSSTMHCKLVFCVLVFTAVIASIGKEKQNSNNDEEKWKSGGITFTSTIGGKS